MSQQNNKYSFHELVIRGGPTAAQPQLTDLEIHPYKDEPSNAPSTHNYMHNSGNIIILPDQALHTYTPTAHSSTDADPATSPLRTPHPPLAQLDGSKDYHARIPHVAPPARGQPSTTTQPHQHSKSAFHDLLPYCTAETPLTQEQAIGLSDVAGSLKEVMLVALRARADERCARGLARVLGTEGVKGVVEFWEEEFEI